jgi:hypothetical protein
MSLAYCQKFEWCITGVNDTGDACIAGVTDTGEACITGINDTGDTDCVSLLVGHDHRLWQYSLLTLIQNIYCICTVLSEGTRPDIHDE